MISVALGIALASAPEGYRTARVGTQVGDRCIDPAVAHFAVAIDRLDVGQLGVASGQPCDPGVARARRAESFGHVEIDHREAEGAS